MPVWRIVVYVTEDRTVPFVSWFNNQDRPVRAVVQAALIALSGEHGDWEDPEVKQFKALTGNDVGLGEVIAEIVQQEGPKQRKRQIRCLGIWPADSREFVLLNGLEKFGKSPNPPNAYREAHRLKRQYGQARGTVDDYFK
jgi:hypothetical protein